MGDSSNPRPVAERFWRFVSPEPNTGCWLWTGSTTNNGYGQIRSDEAGWPRRGAHRIAWEIHHGSLPDGLFVLHRCDNPPCVNPAHLFLGTNAENMQDMVRKGRSPRNASRAKLLVSDIQAIRRRRQSGELIRQIARDYGVCNATIGHIFLGLTWRNVA